MLGKDGVATRCSSRSYSDFFVARWRVTRAVVICPGAPTVLDGDVAGKHLIPCAQQPLVSGIIYGFTRVTTLSWTL